LKSGTHHPETPDASQKNCASPSVSVASRKASARKNRVLVDISQALWHRAGIPQVARQMVSLFSTAPDIETSALILSIHDGTTADLLRKEGDHPHAAMEDAEFLADALGQHQARKRLGPVRYVRKYMERYVDPPYPVVPIRKGFYDDVIWENY